MDRLWRDGKLHGEDLWMTRDQEVFHTLSVAGMWRCSYKNPRRPTASLQRTEAAPVLGARVDRAPSLRCCLDHVVPVSGPWGVCFEAPLRSSATVLRGSFVAPQQPYFVAPLRSAPQQPRPRAAYRSLRCERSEPRRVFDRDPGQVPVHRRILSWGWVRWLFTDESGVGV